MVQGQYPALDPEESHIESLLHSVHVHGLAGVQQHPFARAERWSTEQTLQACPERIGDADAIPEADASPRLVLHDHLLH
jgi:hypothetical protein